MQDAEVNADPTKCSNIYQSAPPPLEYMIATVGTSNGALDWDFPKVVSKAKLLS